MVSYLAVKMVRTKVKPLADSWEWKLGSQQVAGTAFLTGEHWAVQSVRTMGALTAGRTEH